ncbi:unnamed protein product [Sphacelaria rigidula]
MFDGLFRTADSLADRISSASTRCSRLLQVLPEAERRTAEAIGGGSATDDSAAVEAVKALRHKANQAEREAAAKVFLPEAMPRWLVERYHSPEVARVPELHLIDAVISTEEKQLLRKDGLDSCALRYSNPQFFYQEWFRLEMERQDKSVKEKKQKKEERKRRKAAAKAAGAARVVGEQSEESTRVARPAKKSLSDWRGKLSMAGFGAERGGSARSSAGDVTSLVGKERLVVQKQEAYGDKFFRKEEEFADTGYQIAAADTGAAGGPRPLKQPTGALTVEDFYKKPGTSKTDSRRLFLPSSARAGQSGAGGGQSTSSIPPPPQAPAAQPSFSQTPPLPPPPSTSTRPLVPQPPPPPEADSASLRFPPEMPSPDYATQAAPPVPPPPPQSRPPAPQAPPPPPPPPVPAAVVDDTPSRPSYMVWGAEEETAQASPPAPPPPPPPAAPPLPTPDPSYNEEWSSEVPAAPPLPPANPPVPPPLPEAPALYPGEVPGPPPLPPPASATAQPSRSDLMSSIKGGGKTLRPVKREPEDGGGVDSSGNELLDAIKKGAQLNPVKRAEEPSAVANNPLFGGNPGINDILARRQFLEAESEESDSDDDSDWDDE